MKPKFGSTDYYLSSDGPLTPFVNIHATPTLRLDDVGHRAAARRIVTRPMNDFAALSNGDIPGVFPERDER